MVEKFFKSLCLILILVCASFFGECILVYDELPNIYNSTDNSEIVLSNALPVKVVPQQSKIYTDADSIFTGRRQVIPAKITLFDIFPVKSAEIHPIPENFVTPCGTPFGVKLFAKGPMVINISDVKTETGVFSPAEEAGIKKSDTVTHVNGEKISNNEQLAHIVELSAGQPISVRVLRNNNSIDFTAKPVKSIEDKKYKIGMWVRDSSGGVGTATFYDPSKGTFSGLGHGICDIDTGELLPLEHGDVMKASIKGVTKGTEGKPGELKGSFIEKKPIGTLKANIETGVYGTFSSPLSQGERMKIAMKQQVKTGSAKILTTISGETPQYYDINIENINYSEKNPTKNILISITDKKLLEECGGIVQGMSGSPIIQNGMLVGAVTHVFINSPKRGYAIFSETMLEKSNKIFDYMHKSY